ncbi:MAG TPA: PilZ domain-containing protein, partial [Myxococcales bacterium]|nr:PilZ domain-containing protein [Myxococcales bacterium]
GRSGPAPLPGVGPGGSLPPSGEADGARLTPPEGSPRLSPGEEERRRHPRDPVDLLVGVKFDSVQHFLAVYAEDLSESGMFLRSEHAGPLREAGQTLELRFDAGNRRIVEGRARVVRVLEPGAPGNPCGIAIEFIDLDPASRRLIEAIVRIKLAAVQGG